MGCTYAGNKVFMIKYKRLNLHDFKEVFELQKRVYNDLEDKTWYRYNSEDMLYTRIGTASSFGVGAYSDGKLIATGMLIDGSELKSDLCSIEPKTLGDIVLILVEKEHRGNGLQKSIMLKLEHHASEYGFDYICMSVHPENLYCKNNIIDSGYKYDHTDIIYGGLLREIYIKKL